VPDPCHELIECRIRGPFGGALVLAVQPVQLEGQIMQFDLPGNQAKIIEVFRCALDDGRLLIVENQA